MGCGWSEMVNLTAVTTELRAYDEPAGAHAAFNHGEKVARESGPAQDALSPESRYPLRRGSSVSGLMSASFPKHSATTLRVPSS